MKFAVFLLCVGLVASAPAPAPEGGLLGRLAERIHEDIAHPEGILDRIRDRIHRDVEVVHDVLSGPRRLLQERLANGLGSALGNNEMVILTADESNSLLTMLGDTSGSGFGDHAGKSLLDRLADGAKLAKDLALAPFRFGERVLTDGIAKVLACGALGGCYVSVIGPEGEQRVVSSFQSALINMNDADLDQIDIDTMLGQQNVFLLADGSALLDRLREVLQSARSQLRNNGDKIREHFERAATDLEHRIQKVVKGGANLAEHAVQKAEDDIHKLSNAAKSLAAGILPSHSD